LKAAVAVLLLTFITAIIAGFFVYDFMSSLNEKMKTVFPVQPLQCESAYIDKNCLTVYVRSSASVNIQIIEAYVNGNACKIDESIIIPPGDVGLVQLYGAYIKGQTYTVKIVPSIGSFLTFDIKYE